MTRIDGIVVCVCLILGTALGAAYVRASRRTSAVTVTSAFDRRVFGAALMRACGRGLTTPAVPLTTAAAPPQQAVLIDFLAMRRETIACSDIPADVPVDGLDSLQQ